MAFFLFLVAGWSSARLAMLFIRLCAAALFRSVSAARRFFLSLIFSIMPCSEIQSVKVCPEGIGCRQSQCVETYRMLFSHSIGPGHRISAALLLFQPLHFLLRMTLALFILTDPDTRFVSSFHQSLLALLPDLVIVQLQKPSEITCVRKGRGSHEHHCPECPRADRLVLPKAAGSERYLRSVTGCGALFTITHHRLIFYNLVFLPSTFYGRLNFLDLIFER